VLRHKIGFIGAGSIVQTMIKGLSAKRIVKGEQIWVTNKENHKRLRDLSKKYGVNRTADKATLLENADMIIIAVKPCDMPAVLEEIKPNVRETQLLVSVAAGVTTRAIEGCLDKKIPVIRCMPNTSCAVGESATAAAKGRFANEGHLSAACTLFEALGEVVVVDEANMDIVTGLSGSGPAYFYYMIELMEKTAVDAGLSRETAKKLLFQTLYGAARMLKDCNQDPSSLRQRVTSPGGTTFAAMEVFQSMGLEDTITKAVIKAAARSRELGAESISIE